MSRSMLLAAMAFAVATAASAQPMAGSGRPQVMAERPELVARPTLECAKRSNRAAVTNRGQVTFPVGTRLEIRATGAQGQAVGSGVNTLGLPLGPGDILLSALRFGPGFTHCSARVLN